MGELQRRNYLLENNNGFTLVGVLMVLVVLSVLGVSALMITSNFVKMSVGERNDQSVFYIAEAGLTVEMDKIENKIQTAYNNTKNADSFFDKLFLEIVKSDELSSAVFEETIGKVIPKAKIDVVEVSSGNLTRQYKVTSTGIIDKKSRIVEREFSVTWVPKNGGFGDMAVFVKETITMKNGSINGSMGTMKTGANSVIVTGGSITKGSSIYVPKGSEKTAVNKLDWMKDLPEATGIEMGKLPQLPPFPAFPSLPIPANKLVGYKEKYLIQNGDVIINSNGDGCMPLENYKLTLNESRQFNDIKIDNNCSLIIDTGNKDKEIVINDLDLINGHIILTGVGNITIYVKGKLSMGSGASINNNGLSEKIKIYLKGYGNPSTQKVFQLAGSQKVFGSLYAEDANIELNNGGGFKGNIFTGGKTFKVDGGTWTHSPLIFAPSATFTHSNGTINGMIIAKSYEITGGAQLNFAEIGIKEGPISPGAILGLGGSGDAIVERKALREK